MELTLTFSIYMFFYIAYSKPLLMALDLNSETLPKSDHARIGHRHDMEFRIYAKWVPIWRIVEFVGSSAADVALNEKREDSSSPSKAPRLHSEEPPCVAFTACP